jgi:hypothetical protein
MYARLPTPRKDLIDGTVTVISVAVAVFIALYFSPLSLLPLFV